MPNIAPPVKQYHVGYDPRILQTRKWKGNFNRRRRTRGRPRPNAMQQLVNSYQDALNSANAANEQRYNDILSGYDSLHNRAMGAISQQGRQAASDIQENYRQVGANNYNRLVQRGFGNSSLVGSSQLGIAREQNRDMNRLRESLARQQVAADVGITQGKMGVMERRNDVGPDQNQLLNVMQALGQSGYGQQPYQGGGGYGGGVPRMLPPRVSTISPMQAWGGMLNFMLNNPYQQQHRATYNSLRNSARRRLRRSIDARRQRNLAAKANAEE